MHKYFIIVIPENKKRQANLYADGINEDKPKNTGNEKTFSVPLWPISANTEKDAPTHYWCCWWMSEKEQQRAVVTATPAIGAEIYECPPASPEDVLSRLNLKTKDIVL